MTFEEAMTQLEAIVPTGYLLLEIGQWHHSDGPQRWPEREAIKCRVSMEHGINGEHQSMEAATLAGLVATVQAMFAAKTIDRIEAATGVLPSIPSVEEDEAANLEVAAQEERVATLPREEQPF